MNSSYHLVKLYLIGAFVSLAFMCATCFILRPELFDYPHQGLSYYATLWPTIIPYALGLAGGGVCLAVVAHTLRIYGSKTRIIRLFFTIIGNSLLAFLLTSVLVHGIVFWLHMAVGAAILLAQMSLLIWVLRQTDITTVDRVLVGISFMAIVHLVLSNEAIALLGWHVLGQIGALGTGLALLGRLTVRRIPLLSPATKGKR